ncbi:MAG: glycosyltransferase family 2 protein [Candidatus Roizmanbacteria bacterium]|nr:MAG: glycosyltransferase family 2 protein [Candidatus Roizmanbacteria bacterium]
MALLQEKTPILSIIILNYHTENLVTDLLKKLGQEEDVEIILVDNNETDKLHNLVLKDYSYVNYYSLEKNLGFSGGNNLGISKAKGEWILILNSDTLVTIDTIKKLIEKTAEQEYLAASPKLIYGNGKIQNNVAYFDSFLRDPINWLLARPRFLDCSKVLNETKVNFATAAALLIHHSVFQKIGILDDKNFFMYFEDLDLCQRMHQTGIPILYIPSISIIHLEGASANQNPTQKKVYYSRGLNNYLRKHRGIFIEKLNKLFPLFK